MLELLAPAGDIDSFNAALCQGADAVYLGLSNFNARLKADNFSEENISEYIKKAHFYGMRVYVTINTILQNNEFNELISLVKTAVLAKADAFLVQDLGVVKVLKEAFPGIVLHASTQMGVHNLYGAKVAEKLGIKRVVLSRETKIEDIIEIKKNTSLEIEYFIQGALCIAFSGNCYMSSIEQGASGNRGLCKQLCRLPYVASLNGNKYSGYLLSAKDLSLANNLKELVDAGVTSFKIEGRMRRPGYVATAVNVYRKLLDKIENNKDAKLSKEDESALKAAFSRGDYLDSAYLEKGTPFVVEKTYGNHAGVEIGYVKNVKPFKDDLFKVDIFSKKEIHNGDGLKFFENGIEKASLGVGDSKKIDSNIFSFITKTKVKVGYKVNLILDIESEEKLLNIERTIPISLKIKANVGEKLLIEAKYKEIETSSISELPLEAAKNSPMTEDEIIKQASKVGGTGFSVDKCLVETNGVFIAKSIFNQVRRDALDLLKEKIISSNDPKQVKCQNFNEIEDLNENNYSAQIIDENTEIINKVDYFVLSLDTFSISRANEMIKLLNLDLNKTILKLPIIANSKDIEIIDNILTACKIKNVLSENIYGLYYLEKGYTVFAGAGHNVANKYAASLLNEMDVSLISKSIEYKNEIVGNNVIDIKNEIPVMTFAHCPYKTIFANECNKCSYKAGLTLLRNGKEYKIRRIKLAQCYFELMN